MEIKNQRGQTVVEYILLLAVSMSLVITFYRSATFKKLFGNDGTVGKLYKWEAEWGYRHAYTFGRKQGELNVPYTSASDHPSYVNKDKSQSRFFGPNDTYK